MISLLVISYLNELKSIRLYTDIEIVSTALNGFKYCKQYYFLFNINHLFADSEIVTRMYI